MEQLLTGDIWSATNRMMHRKCQMIACIAYVTVKNLKLKKDDILICDASEYSIRAGHTSAKILLKYLNLGVTIYSNASLHAKLLLTDDYLVIGSANMSESSAKVLTEAAVVTQSEVLRAQTKSFCYNLIKESQFVGIAEIKDLLRIKVTTSFKNPVRSSKVRKTVYGNNTWFLNVYPLKERAYKKISAIVERNATELSQLMKLDIESIGFVKWRTNTEFSKNAKEGDQIILRFNNEARNRSHLYPPSTILKKEVIGGYTYFYHDDSNSEEKRISWSKFQDLAAKLSFDRTFSKRVVLLSSSDVITMKSLWDII